MRTALCEQPAKLAEARARLTVADASVQLNAARLLLWTGHDDEEVAAALFSVVRTGSDEQRDEAVRVLICKDDHEGMPCPIPPNSPRVRVLAALLDGWDLPLRRKVALALAQSNLYEEEIRRQMPALVLPTLGENGIEKQERQELVRVLSQVGLMDEGIGENAINNGRIRELSIAALRRDLTDKDPCVRGAAAVSLARADEVDERVLEVLRTYLRDPLAYLAQPGRAFNGLGDEYLYYEAMAVLDKAGHGGEITALLRAHLADESLNIRYRVALALIKLGEGGTDVKEALVASLEDDNTDVERFAVDWLKGAGGSSPQLVDYLYRRLHAGGLGDRQWAASILLDLGCVSDAALALMVASVTGEERFDDVDVLAGLETLVAQHPQHQALILGEAERLLRAATKLDEIRGPSLVLKRLGPSARIWELLLEFVSSPEQRAESLAALSAVAQKQALTAPQVALLDHALTRQDGDDARIVYVRSMLFLVLPMG